MPSKPQTFRPGYIATRREQTKQYDARRGTARQRGYGTAWDKASAAYRRLHPLCLGCQAIDRVEAATVVDHIVPHKGDMALFWDSGNWQPSCRWHHNVIKQTLEREFERGAIKAEDLRLDSSFAIALTGRLQRIADDGLEDSRELFYPRVPASVIPLIIICGPAAAGKSTFVRQHAQSRDIVIDLDDIIAELFPSLSRSREWQIRRAALIERNARLRSLANQPKNRSAWFLTGAARAHDRRHWAARLKPQRMLLMATPLDVCVARINADESRSIGAAAQIEAARNWWQNYTPREGDEVI